MNLLGRAYWGLPIPIWGALLSSLSMIVGWQWDICWHRSIGRDTVWTPPHIAIYIALALAFLYNAWLVLKNSFRGSLQTPGISVLGFRGPAGSFLTLAGILLQFLAIVWDDWWHNVYGLDVGVFSPPHVLIAYGINLFYIGQFLVLASYRNNGETGKATRWAALVLWSFFLGHTAIAAEDLYGPFAVRSLAFVQTSASVFPIVLISLQVYLGSKWASFKSAVLYMLLTIILMQIFQLFPATPQFGPVYHRVANFLPPVFPLLLVVPALLLQPLVRRAVYQPGLRNVLLIAMVFVVAFNGTNWLSSGFLMTSWADNRFFAGGYPGSVFEENFRQVRTLGFDLASGLSLLLAFVFATVTSWVALAAGKWLRSVVR